MLALALSLLVAFTPDLNDGAALARQIAGEYAGASGVAVRKRVLRVLRNGKALGPADLVKLSRTEDGPLSRFGMHGPWLSANVADYTFAKPREIGDLLLVDFTSVARDSAHGDGTLVYTRAAHRIDHVLYTPAALPNDGGAIVLLTATLDIMTSLYAGYRVHGTQAEAIAALEGESG